MSPEQKDVREDDWDEEEDDARRSIFTAGWFRAVLVLTVLAIVVVVGLPYLLNWFEPPPAPLKMPPSPARRSESPAGVDSARSAPVPTAPVVAAPEPALAPTAPPSAANLAPEQTRTTPAPPPAPAGSAATAPGKPVLPSQTTKGTAGTSRPDRVAAISAKADGTRGQSADGYWVQLGLFKDARNAEQLAETLRGQGFAIQVSRVTRPEAGTAAGNVSPGTYYLVRAGGFRDQARALSARDALREKGYSGFLTEGAAH